MIQGRLPRSSHSQWKSRNESPSQELLELLQSALWLPCWQINRWTSKNTLRARYTPGRCSPLYHLWRIDWQSQVGFIQAMHNRKPMSRAMQC